MRFLIGLLNALQLMAVFVWAVASIVWWFAIATGWVPFPTAPAIYVYLAWTILTLLVGMSLDTNGDR